MEPTNEKEWELDDSFLNSLTTNEIGIELNNEIYNVFSESDFANLFQKRTIPPISELKSVLPNPNIVTPSAQNQAPLQPFQPFHSTHFENPSKAEIQKDLKLHPILNEAVSPASSTELEFSSMSSGEESQSPPEGVDDEVLQLLQWKPKTIEEKHQKRRRESHTKEAQQQKHKKTEKKRRNDMNELFEKLKANLPINQDSKMTKLTILQHLADYITKMKDLCRNLIKENRDLKARLNASTTVGGLTTPRTSQTDTCIVPPMSLHISEKIPKPDPEDPQQRARQKKKRKTNEGSLATDATRGALVSLWSFDYPSHNSFQFCEPLFSF